MFAQLTKTSSGQTPHALAAELHLNPKYVRLWCETACALELLDYDPSAGYRPAPCMEQILGEPESTYYLGGFPDIHLLITRDYARYLDLFRTGGQYTYQEHDEIFLRSIAEGTCVLPRMFLGAVLPNLPRLQATLESGATILDVGCGAGYAMVDIAERYPNVRCVGIEIEQHSIQLAQELIGTRELGSRVEVRRMDGADVPSEFAGAFDLVMSFLVLHEIRPDQKRAVLEQCARALRSDGTLLIFDECYPSNSGELRDPAQIYAVMAQWYEMTWGNIINTKEEIHAMLAEQGMRIVDETSLSRFYIVTAEKDH